MISGQSATSQPRQNGYPNNPNCGGSCGAMHSGESFSLAASKGKNVVIAFYPFAFTPV